MFRFWQRRHVIGGVQRIPNATIKKPGRSRKAVTDLIAVLLCAVAGFAFTSTHNVSERYIAWASQYERWNIDELPLLFTFLAIGTGVYAFRRYLELRKEIVERRQVEAALREERDFIAAVLDTAGSLVVVLDRQGHVLRFNRACERVSGYSFAEAQSRDLWNKILPPEEIEQVGALFERLWKGETSNEYVNHWVARDGTRRLIAWSNSAILGADGTPQYVIGTGIDITERQRAEDALRASEQEHLALLNAMQRQAQDLELLNRVIATTTSVLEPNAVLKIICEQLARAFHLPQAAAALLDADKTHLRVVAEYCAPGRPGALGAMIAVRDNPATQYVLANHRPLALMDARTDPGQAAFHALAKQRGTVSLLIVPLFIRGQVVGTLGLDAIERREFSAEEIALAETVANAAGRALENAYLYAEIQRELTERKQAEEMQARMAAIVESSGDAIISVGLDGSITSWNAGAERICGYQAHEIIGQPASLLVPQAMRDERLALYRSIESSDRIVQNETVWRHKDGRQIDVSLTVSPIISDGSIESYAVIARDITEHKRAERLKNEFIATVSHELRTPLTSIRGALGLISGGVTGELAAPTKAMIEIAHANSERLGRLIDDILDIEKIEAGKMTFVLRPLAIMPLVEQAIAANQTYGDQFGVTFVLEQALAAESAVCSDGDRLMQVLNNLLSNAAKFSPPGSAVRIAVSQNAHTLRIAVRDFGSGIPLEFRDRIFQKFAQADSSDTRQKGGTGLGLSIVKAIVERLGAQIGYEVHEPGTTFYVDLPVECS